MLVGECINAEPDLLAQNTAAVDYHVNELIMI